MNFKYIMVDIWGRSTREKPTDDKKITDEVKKIIKDEISNNFNLVSVDPGEIVVFGDSTGKLKTSNVSFDSLLTKPEGVADDSIAVFKQGKITAGDKLSSITEKLTIVNDTAADLKLLIDDLAKFFGSPRQFFENVKITQVAAAIDSLIQLRSEYYSHVIEVNAAMNNLTQLRNEYNTHVANFAQLRRNFNIADNAIEKFFGKKKYQTR